MSVRPAMVNPKNYPNGISIYDLSDKQKSIMKSTKGKHYGRRKKRLENEKRKS